MSDHALTSDRRSSPTIVAVSIDTAALQALMTDGLKPGAGAWSVGVPGALGEFVTDRSSTIKMTRTDQGSTIVAYACGGAFRFNLDEDTHVFATHSRKDPKTVTSITLAAPRQPDPTVRVVIEEIGVDPDPICSPGGETCFDLGLARQAATFAVRTGNRSLTALLRAHTGNSWTALMADHGADIVRLSPTRVIQSSKARIEVFAPIPPPEGRSPDGCHTHLLPKLLARGRESPPGVDLPPGLLPTATFHPAPDWINPFRSDN